jgi:hypothetical protein
MLNATAVPVCVWLRTVTNTSAQAVGNGSPFVNARNVQVLSEYGLPSGEQALAVESVDRLAPGISGITLRSVRRIWQNGPVHVKTWNLMETNALFEVQSSQQPGFKP